LLHLMFQHVSYGTVDLQQLIVFNELMNTRKYSFSSSSQKKVNAIGTCTSCSPIRWTYVSGILGNSYQSHEITPPHQFRGRNISG
jgi:hypothetical protein